jgi:hypothetical protein
MGLSENREIGVVKLLFHKLSTLYFGSYRAYLDKKVITFEDTG